MAKVTPGKYKAAWIQAKKDFQSKSRVKKPAETLLWFRRASGIEPALGKLDTLTKNIARSQKDYKAYEAAFKAFETKLIEYDKLLVAAYKTPKPPSGADPAAYKSAVAQLQIDLSDIQNTARRYMSTVETAMNLLERVRANVKKARTFIQQVRRDPTPERFNEDVDTIARHITQQINNVTKVKTAGFDIGRKAPTNLGRILEAWGNDGRQLADDASREDVLDELDAFEQAINGVAKWAA